MVFEAMIAMSNAHSNSTEFVDVVVTLFASTLVFQMFVFIMSKFRRFDASRLVIDTITSTLQQNE